VPCVDRVLALCSGVQQHAGEAACRRPDVERGSAGGGDVEGSEGGLQLRLAAERQILS